MELGFDGSEYVALLDLANISIDVMRVKMERPDVTGLAFC